MQTYVFIDASNLFYGFDTEYGWKIDYELLKIYLDRKYNALSVMYFGGIDIIIGVHKNEEYFYDYSKNDTVDLGIYLKHLEDIMGTQRSLSELQNKSINKSIKHVRFCIKLQSFGYVMILKPIKYFGKGNILQSKANCDVDLTIEVMKNIEFFDTAIIMSGDGDFLPLYKFIERNNKKIYVISRSSKTAREIRVHLASIGFVEIGTIRKQIEFVPKRKKP